MLNYMKKIYEYTSFEIAVLFTASEVVYLLLVKKIEFNLFNLIVCSITISSWLVFSVIYGRVKRIKNNPVYIYGKLIPESVRLIPFLRYSLIKATVIYYDPHTDKTTLYKGTCSVVWLEYQALKNGSDIFVRVVYDAKNPNNYQVLLEEALKDIKIF